MLRVFLAAQLVVSLLFSIAHAQLGTVCVYSDPTTSQCNFAGSPGLVEFYVVHVQSAGATGIRYSAPLPDCWPDLIFIADDFQHPIATGSSQNGASVSYGSCASGAVHVQTIVAYAQSQALSDCPYPVLPDPLASQIEVVDCNSNVLPGIGGTAYINSAIPCACDGGSAGPVLSVSPGHLDFYDYASEETVEVFNAGGGTLTWSVTESIPWLEASPGSGTGAGDVLVVVDRTGLAFGSYTGMVDVTSNGGNQTVTVAMEVAPLVPVLDVLSPDSLHIPYDENSVPIVFRNTGNTDLVWSFDISEPWLSATPSNGTTARTGFEVASIVFHRAGLTDGRYEQTIRLNSNGGNAEIKITADVTTGAGIEVSPLLLQYSSTTTSHRFYIRDVGQIPLTWSLSTAEPWISIVPPLSGTGDATVTVTVDPALVPPGDLVVGEVAVASNADPVAVQIAFYRTGAPGGVIGLFTDIEASNCAIWDVDGLVSVYALLTATPGAAAIQFAAPKPNCMNATWIADSNPFLVIGDSQVGAAISFGGCVPAPVHVMTIQYVGTGTTDPCCEYPVIPDPRAPTGTIEVVDCSNTKTFALSRSGFVNPDETCNCGVPVKVENRTWGAVKALYLPDRK